MKAIITVLIVTMIALVLTVSVNAQEQARSDNFSINISLPISGGASFSKNFSLLVTTGEDILRNATSDQGFNIYVGFLTQTNKQITLLFQIFPGCIAVWTCSGFVVNSTMEYRQCTNLTTCTNETNFPGETRPRNDWLIAVALISAGSTWLFFRTGEELSRNFNPIKVFLLIISVLLLSVASQFAIEAAIDNGATANIVTTLEMINLSMLTVLFLGGALAFIYYLNSVLLKFKENAAKVTTESSRFDR